MKFEIKHKTDNEDEYHEIMRVINRYAIMETEPTTKVNITVSKDGEKK